MRHYIVKPKYTFKNASLAHAARHFVLLNLEGTSSEGTMGTSVILYAPFRIYKREGRDV